MSRSLFEICIGAFIIIFSFSFFFYAYRTADVRVKTDGYTLIAEFDRVDGLAVGNDVRLAGVKIGQVTKQHLNMNNYNATVTMVIDNDVRIPDDSFARVASEGFLGGKYMVIEPGGSETMLQEGDMITFTQSAVSLETLIGKMIFDPKEPKTP